MSREFYSNGKLLLTGEYVILNGAIGLAVPTTYGQTLHVSENEGSIIKWTSIAYDGSIWFETHFNGRTLDITLASDIEIAKTLQKILKQAIVLNPSFLSNSKGYSIETQLDFDRTWGLGSSSTLINNIAQWAQVDAYQLLWNAFSGSGYDIACAQHNTPILYQIEKNKAKVSKIVFNPSFKDQLFFIHLNKKQNSRDGIAAYKKREIDKGLLIEQINKLTQKIAKCSDLSDFEKLIELHENLLSKAMGIPTIKSQLFSDYSGAIKSLGAWGGDFILATNNGNLKEYFTNKGHATIIAYTDMVL